MTESLRGAESAPSSAGVVSAAITLLGKELRRCGFARTRGAFTKRSVEGNLLVVAIQRSSKSSRARSLVTINYGVYSAHVASALRRDVKTTATDAHWWRRLSDGNQERWLPVLATDSAPATAKCILSALGTVLPDLQAHATDSSLRDEWLAGSSPGLTNMERLLFLAVLLKKVGPADALTEVLRELEDGVASGRHPRWVQDALVNAGVTHGH